jgi:hypothetical protein
MEDHAQIPDLSTLHDSSVLAPLNLLWREVLRMIVLFLVVLFLLLVHELAKIYDLDDLLRPLRTA